MNLENFFSSELILENESILLRPLSIDDIDKIESISYNKELGEFGARVKNRNDLTDYFSFCLNSKKEKELYPLIIIRKEDNSPIGLTMFGNFSFQNKRLEIGWTWIGKKFQGTGINVICKELLLDYCFDTLNLRRVEFKIDVKNLKSQKAIEKIGAIKEGFLRNYNIQSYGDSEGTYVYSILKEEWKN
ncbi:GNAT family N-acetyltransferase [Flavobacterium undicola]|uniref:GNAT family N-acetyltransferase n=1 Tax=Flavobacterium undicola TaxID=1932779 RepID=UPI001377A61C|nr:GNAT family N-acetyltransferase [Flavobacterium undicola]MBA0884676.1 GNAT family N-acetyltransferase [Flavobacterium undicola]